MKILVACASVMAAVMTPGAASAVVYYGGNGAVSTYVRDWAQGATYTNYAFNASTSAFVGSWRVDHGPIWSSMPISYSGLDTAALLFGGAPTDYFISTVDAVAAHADRQAWASQYNAQCATFAACGIKVAEDFAAGATSAPVPSTVPEPAVWTMLVGGFGLVGAGVRRRRGAAPARG